MNNDVYGRTVDMTSDGTTDFYIVGGAFEFQFPAGTGSDMVYLAFAKQGKILRFQGAMQDFLLTRYPLETRWSFIALYITAQANILLVNRRAYIAALFAWANSIISYSAVFSASVNAAATADDAAALNWDFGTLATADPVASPLVAAAINN